MYILNFLLIFLVCILIFYPYIVTFVKRIYFSFKLSACCKKHGYTLTVTSPFWILSNFKSSRPTFYVETPATVFAVKLVGTPFKLHYFDFQNKNYYSVYNTQLIKLKAVTVPPKQKKWTQYDFQFYFDDRFAMKNFKQIILIYPVPGLVLSSGTPCGNGDNIFQGLFYTKSGFLKLLTEEGE